MIPIAFWQGLAVGLLASGVGTVLVWLYLRRGQRRSSADASALPSATPTSTPTPPATMAHPIGAAAPVSDATPRPMVADLPPVLSLAAVEPTEAALGPAAPSRLTGANGGQLKISHRVLLHLASQGQIDPDGVQPRALSQAGMVESLEVPQGALTGVLRRLVAAGVVEERRAHVQGSDRRLKVYWLTSSGVELTRELRSRRPP